MSRQIPVGSIFDDAGDCLSSHSKNRRCFNRLSQRGETVSNSKDCTALEPPGGDILSCPAESIGADIGQPHSLCASGFKQITGKQSVIGPDIGSDIYLRKKSGGCFEAFIHQSR